MENIEIPWEKGRGEDEMVAWLIIAYVAYEVCR